MNIKVHKTFGVFQTLIWMIHKQPSWSNIQHRWARWGNLKPTDMNELFNDGQVDVDKTMCLTSSNFLCRNATSELIQTQCLIYSLNFAKGDCFCPFRLLVSYVSMSPSSFLGTSSGLTKWWIHGRCFKAGKGKFKKQSLFQTDKITLLFLTFKSIICPVITLHRSIITNIY